MSFNYTSPFGIRLTATEKQLLEKIDNLQYPLHGFSDIGGIHNGLRGDVVLSNQRRSRHYSYEMTVAECMAKIKELDVEIQKINDKLSTLHTRYEEARNNHDDDKANRLEEEMGYLGRNRQGLESTKEVYQEAISNGKYKIEGDTDILGEYDSTSNQVILYYKSISSEELLAVVYVHEMMHAYLDCGQTFIEEIEEPIVEYGMLKVLKAFGDASLFTTALEYVESKKHSLGVAHYGFGYCIFMNQNNIDWLEDYRIIKTTLSLTDPAVLTYRNYWKTGVYPDTQEQNCLQALYDVLHTGGYGRTMTIHYTRRHVAIQSINKNNLLARLVVYLALPTAKTTLNTITPYDHDRWLRLGGLNINSTVRQYMDWINHLRHPELLPLLNKHGIADIYSCDDLKKIVSMFDELVDNTSKEAQNANRHQNMVSAVRHFIEHLLSVNGITI